MRRYLPILLFIGLAWGQRVNYHSDNPDNPCDDEEYIILDSKVNDLFGEDFIRWGVLNDECNTYKTNLLREKKEARTKNFTINQYLILPFAEDKYGVEKQLKNQIDGTPIDNYNALEYIDEKNLHLDKLTDYHLRKLGKMNEVDWVIHGSIYMMNKELAFNKKSRSQYTPSPEFLVNKERTNKKDIYESDFDLDLGLASSKSDIMYEVAKEVANEVVSILDYSEKESKKDAQAQKIVDAEKQRKEQNEILNKNISLENRLEYNRAKAKSGTWIYGTIFKINTKSGEKVYLYENEGLFKIN